MDVLCQKALSSNPARLLVCSSQALLLQSLHSTATSQLPCPTAAQLGQSSETKKTAMAHAWFCCRHTTARQMTHGRTAGASVQPCLLCLRTVTDKPSQQLDRQHPWLTHTGICSAAYLKMGSSGATSLQCFAIKQTPTTTCKTSCLTVRHCVCRPKS